MAEVDLFMAPVQADKDDCDEDDMYTNLAAAITVRKCKIEQKKQKLKLTVYGIKKCHESLKNAKKDKTNIHKEKEEVTHQEALKLANIQSWKDSRHSLETVQCDLRNKVSLKKIEVKENSDKYKKIVQDSRERFKAYLEEYNKFVFAMERNEVRIEVKKANITREIIKRLIADSTTKQKRTEEIAERRLHVLGVKVAKLYADIQQKKQQTAVLSTKIRELKTYLEELKTKNTSIKTPSNNNKENHPDVTNSMLRLEEAKKVSQAVRILQLEIPTIQVTSPPFPSSTNEENRSKSGSLFNWRNLLNYNYLNMRQKPQKSQKTPQSNVNSSDYSKKDTIAKVGSLLTKPSAPISDPNIQKPSDISPNLQDSSNTAAETTTKKPNAATLSSGQNTENTSLNNRGEKRLNHFETEIQSKKLAQNNAITFNAHQSKLNINASNKPTLKSMDYNEIDNKTKQITEKSKSIGSKFNKSDNKENNKTDRNNTSVSGMNIKAYLESLTRKKNPQEYQRKVNKTHNLNIQTANQPTTKTHDNNVPYETNLSSFRTNFSGNSKQMMNNQLEQQHNDPGTTNVDVDMFPNENNNKQNEHIMAMDPTSPPDVIPVESNSQTMSQSNAMGVSSGKFPSLSLSDFNSPLELDEAGKLHYERIAAESPGFVYPKGPGLLKSSNQEMEMGETVRSQYFLSGNSQTSQQSLNTPTSTEQYRPSLLSPPDNLNNGQMNTILSPPSATLGGFTIGRNISTGTSIFDTSSKEENKSSDGLLFNFTSSRTSKPSSSIFSLF